MRSVACPRCGLLRGDLRDADPGERVSTRLQRRNEAAGQLVSLQPDRGKRCVVAEIGTEDRCGRLDGLDAERQRDSRVVADPGRDRVDRGLLGGPDRDHHHRPGLPDQLRDVELAFADLVLVRFPAFHRLAVKELLAFVHDDDDERPRLRRALMPRVLLYPVRAWATARRSRISAWQASRNFTAYPQPGTRERLASTGASQQAVKVPRSTRPCHGAIIM